MYVFACRYWLSRKTDDLVEFTDGITEGDGMDGKFVACGNVGDDRDVKAREALTRRDWLEGNRDVVRDAEHKCVRNQTDLVISVN